jgi:nitroreductase
MNVIDAIRERRSIRKYQNKDVPKGAVRDIIEAARLAPSGNNAQPWKFIVLRKEEIEKLKGVFPQDFVYTAPVIIVCSGCPDYYKSKDKDDLNETRANRDVSIASGFMVLRATELGLGTCYIGWLDRKKIKKALKIPENHVVPFAITLGYPAGEPRPKSVRKFSEICEGL